MGSSDRHGPLDQLPDQRRRHQRAPSRTGLPQLRRAVQLGRASRSQDTRRGARGTRRRRRRRRGRQPARRGRVRTEDEWRTHGLVPDDRRHRSGPGRAASAAAAIASRPCHSGRRSSGSTRCPSRPAPRPTRRCFRPRCGSIATGSAPLPPATPIESRLCEIWCDVLGLDGVGVTDDFFDLGGASLDALEVVAAVDVEYGTDLHDAAVFRARTIRELAAVVSTGLSGESGSNRTDPNRADLRARCRSRPARRRCCSSTGWTRPTPGTTSPVCTTCVRRRHPGSTALEHSTSTVSPTPSAQSCRYTSRCTPRTVPTAVRSRRCRRRASSTSARRSADEFDRFADEQRARPVRSRQRTARAGAPRPHRALRRVDPHRAAPHQHRRRHVRPALGRRSSSATRRAGSRRLAVSCASHGHGNGSSRIVARAFWLEQAGHRAPVGRLGVRFPDAAPNRTGISRCNSTSARPISRRVGTRRSPSRWPRRPSCSSQATRSTRSSSASPRRRRTIPTSPTWSATT